MARFRAEDLVVDTKPDLTPVSDADRTAEELIRHQLGRTRPRDAVEGRGVRHHRARPAPVAARPHRRDHELRAGRPGLGHAHRARRRRRPGRRAGRRPRPAAALVGGQGFGSVCRPVPVRRPAAGRVGCGRAERGLAVLLLDQRVAGARAGSDAFLDLLDECWRTRAYGDFWSYMLLAEGAVDIAAEPELNTYDMAALVPVVTEAGGRFTGLDGRDGLLERQRRGDQRPAARAGAVPHRHRHRPAPRLDLRRRLHDLRRLRMHQASEHGFPTLRHHLPTPAA